MSAVDPSGLSERGDAPGPGHALTQARLERAWRRQAATVSYLLDRHLTVLWASDSVEELLGRSVAEVVGRSFLDEYDPAVRGAAAHGLGAFLARVERGDRSPMPLIHTEMRGPGDTLVPVQLKTSEFLDDPEIDAILIIATVTEELGLFMRLIDTAMSAHNPAATVEAASKVLARAVPGTVLAAAERHDRSWLPCAVPDGHPDGEAMVAMLDALPPETWLEKATVIEAAASRPWSGDDVVTLAPVTGVDGELIAALLAVRRERGALANWLQTGWLGFPTLAIRLVQRSFLEQQVRRRLIAMAGRDALTGLANRARFYDELATAVARSRRYGRKIAVVYFDLDRFKSVNDRYGHAAGDDLLRQVGDRVRSVLRAGDLAARLGGDEFTLLLEDVGTEADAMTVARRVWNTFDEPFDLGITRISSSPSIGVAVLDDHVIEVDDLLRAADAALYRAKELGRNRVELYDLALRKAIEDRRLAHNELRDAVRQRAIGLWFQPVVHLGTGAIVGAEALARWNHPDRGLLEPASFLASAEELGLMTDLTKHLISELVRFRADLTAHGVADEFRVSLNVSGADLQDLGLLEAIRHEATRYRVNPLALMLEVTEASVIRDFERAKVLLADCVALGMRVSLDNFGTGWSSLTVLRDLPVHMVKIDRRTVAALSDREVDRVVVAAALAVGRQLNLDVVAEGVETAQQRDQLLAMGCTHGQGYLFARPMPGDELLELLRAQAQGGASSAA